ncbi:MAG TPA: hypothetical protein VFV49_00040 [Thermoanaerobaculia bacterium]|nr:hypothetical protein [Thermoanaerobaculia bacterium]
MIRRERVAESNRPARGDESRNRARAAESSIEVRGERNRSAGGRIERDRTPANRSEPAYRGGESQTQTRTYDRNQSDRGSTDRNRTDRSGTVNRERSNRDRSSRNDGTWRNNDSRNNDSRSRGSYGRGDSRSRGSYGRGDSRSRGTYRDSRYGNRSPFRYSGRVHRVYPYGGGYRVWLTGCQYPFFIPSAYYHRNRFRVGVTIALGGFYNSRGYYDYYDGYDDGYYDSRTSRGELRGVVESVDYRRETFVVRNEATGSFVTVVMRDRGRDPVRAGDYVELGGDWTRSGLFEAYRVDIVDYEHRR